MFDLPSDGDAYMANPVSEAALTGASLIRHLDDVRFASLRALRQLLRALDAERIAIGFVAPKGESIREELVWARGFARCGESERVLCCAGFAHQVRDWLSAKNAVVSIDIDVESSTWHELPCDRLLLVRGELIAEGRERLVLAVQLRGEVDLADGACHALTLFLNEYGSRRSLIKP